MAVLWVRCDMLILLGPIALSWLITRKISFTQLIIVGGLIGVGSLLITVSIDSLFWQRLLWPEGVVLFFNTVENKSHQWGVEPWYWYLTSALPRAFIGFLPLIPLSCFTITNETSSNTSSTSIFSYIKRIRFDWIMLEYLLPVSLFIFLYSFLPHKELRFLLPAFPILYIAAGNGMAKLYRISLYCLGYTSSPSTSTDNNKKHDDNTTTMEQSNGRSAAFSFGDSIDTSQQNNKDGIRQRTNVTNKFSSTKETVTNPSVPTIVPSKPVSLLSKLTGLSILGGILGLIIISSILTIIFIRVSMYNYPGGVALQRLYTRYNIDLKRASRIQRTQLDLLLWTFEQEEIKKQYNNQDLIDYPACPEYDVTSTSIMEWSRECLSTGCPNVLPWSSWFTNLENNRPCISLTNITNNKQHLRPIRLHIDGAAAESGVSRYGEAWGTHWYTSNGWLYSKDETLKTAEQYQNFDILLTGNFTFHAKYFDTTEVIEGMPSFQISRTFPFIRINTNPTIYIMKRKPDPLQFQARSA